MYSGFLLSLGMGKHMLSSWLLIDLSLLFARKHQKNLCMENFALWCRAKRVVLIWYNATQEYNSIHVNIYSILLFLHLFHEGPWPKPDNRLGKYSLNRGVGFSKDMLLRTPYGIWGGRLKLVGRERRRCQMKQLPRLSQQCYEHIMCVYVNSYHHLCIHIMLCTFV